MKIICTSLAALAVFTASAQSNQPPASVWQPDKAIHSSTNQPNAAPINPIEQHVTQNALADETFDAQFLREARATPVLFKEPKPNETTMGRFTLSGIGVQLALVHNPLQLINPLAPLEYGSEELNLVRDPINGHPAGLKLFSIQF